jgi:ubiquinone/menaquinone biosynthesis C-methylase UbiE
MVFVEAVAFLPDDFMIQGVPWFIELILLAFVFFFIGFCLCLRLVRYLWKFPFPAALGNLISAGPYRNRVQPPSMVVDAMALKSGMHVIELGCGSGLFTLAVARAIQPDGVLYAVDIQQGMLDKMMARMHREGIENVVPVLADAGGQIPLEAEIADAAFSVAVVPEIPRPVEALKQVHRLLKDNGIYADAEVLMDPDYPLKRTVRKWAQRAGFHELRSSGGLFRYVLVFEKVTSNESRKDE